MYKIVTPNIRIIVEYLIHKLINSIHSKNLADIDIIINEKLRIYP